MTIVLYTKISIAERQFNINESLVAKEINGLESAITNIHFAFSLLNVYTMLFGNEQRDTE